MARVTKSTWYVGEHFDIRYILDHRQEHHLDSSELTRRNLSQDDRRPKRTQIAAKFGKRHQSFDKTSLFSPSPSRSPEADTIAALGTRLESEIERRANDVAALQRQVRLEREAKRELALGLREAAARKRSIQQSLETVRIKSQADAEAMSCRVLELLDEAAESAAAEAQSKRDAAIQQLRRETTA